MLTAVLLQVMMGCHLPLLAMSEEQLSTLLAKLKDDKGLQEKLKGELNELSDEELEGVTGGMGIIRQIGHELGKLW
jgi:hypothetical protein